MSLAAIAQYLRTMVGLDESALGPGVLERSVRRRLAATQLQGYEAYYRELERSAEELQALVNDVTVPETSFFRDPGVFRALTEIVVAEWRNARSRRTLRILSAPCSTGEEPYSIAMTLLDAGLTADRFTIEAVDINQRVLANARRAVYGNGSFRGRELSFRDRYFHRTLQGWELDAQVRDCVRIRHGNLLDPQLASQPYDVVFCRNVLIYFDAPTQLQAMQRLDALVAPDGVLFLGAAETFLSQGTAFRSLGRPMSFGFRKSDSPAEQSRPTQPIKTRPPGRLPTATARTPKRRQPREAARATQSAEIPTAAHSGESLDRADILANSGKLREAAEICRSHLEQHGPNARAYFLLGVVSDALGESSEAISYFRKVLYVQPDHEQALLHLALLTRGQGAANHAVQFERRARTLGRTGGDT